ncbi:unnamed protein product [Rhizophagus irregularis]|nr:unnamed protein product [Rhizophagus irregularis]
MEWYHVWNAEYINHKQEHDLGVIEPEECLACEICNPIEREVSAAFKKFWDALFKFEDTILMYNNVTHKELLNLLSMDNREREDTIHKGKCRNIVDRIIESIRNNEHGYILEDWDVENRFQKFWDWYNTILENEMKAIHVKKLAIKLFRDLLYEETEDLEPEDPESDSPESYELEDSDGSIHYEIKIEEMSNGQWNH